MRSTRADVRDWSYCSPVALMGDCGKQVYNFYIRLGGSLSYDFWSSGIDSNIYQKKQVYLGINTGLGLEFVLNNSLYLAFEVGGSHYAFAEHIFSVLGFYGAYFRLVSGWHYRNSLVSVKPYLFAQLDVGGFKFHGKDGSIVLAGVEFVSSGLALGGRLGFGVAFRLNRMIEVGLEVGVGMLSVVNGPGWKWGKLDNLAVELDYLDTKSYFDMLRQMQNWYNQEPILFNYITKLLDKNSDEYDYFINNFTVDGILNLTDFYNFLSIWYDYWDFDSPSFYFRSFDALDIVMQFLTNGDYLNLFVNPDLIDLIASFEATMINNDTIVASNLLERSSMGSRRINLLPFSLSIFFHVGF